MFNLTVKLDHVATLRQAMQASEPDPVAAAVLAEMAGADGIAVHLLEDRRHIQERDVRLLRQIVQSRLILHMAPTSEMMGIALDVKPERVVLMPELMDDPEFATGIDLTMHGKGLFEIIDTLQSNGISVAICVLPEPAQAQLVHQLRADWIQIHAGRLRDATSPVLQRRELDNIIDTVKMAHKLRTHIAVGHGLDLRLIKLFSGVLEIDEFSLGRSLAAQAMLVGIDRAVREVIAAVLSLRRGSRV